MKNYLFAPFKDDDEKIEEFNRFKTYLPNGHINTLVMFIGRLESYYDVMIEKSEKAWIEVCNGKVDKDYHNDVFDENKELKAENEDLIKACNMLRAEVKELKKVEVKSGIKACNMLRAEVKELKAEIKRKDTL